MRKILQGLAKRSGFYSSLSALKWDALRLKARLGYLYPGKEKLFKKYDKLHLGCGSRKYAGWLNVDLINSDYNVDLAHTPLPFQNDSFRVITSQQVIEHLRLEQELIPLFRELLRVLKPGGNLWLSCPDMEKICNSYLIDKGKDLLRDRLDRYPDNPWRKTPYTQEIINFYFHQDGEHKNLFDFEMLKAELIEIGFSQVIRVSEDRLLASFKEIPLRGDDFHSVYVLAIR